ncbi:ABC transporter substrate-binding protein [Coleofasciculus sp. FACHB-SPT9]|uniref:ABC transporter substrate-binding protein n=1 Tax=Cyanophyceae TaxID=3028117 RepID=UPI0016842642|nr:ABC transporter substrate-binding protein [Coleofasciculus sp. FACHB-SPT9]MBD1889004.1 peptide ABC transporter substrate-binding protein [Coleofasciculus sp. FACHB-SPT9]
MKWGRLSIHRWRFIGQFFCLFCLCCFLAISCGKRPASDSATSPSPGGANSGRITIGTTQKPRTMDPADNYELAAVYLLYNLSDRLYTYELGSTQLKPQLATAMPKVSPDGLTYTIPVRQGVVFHDGTPFNAKAMEFSLQRFIENKGKPSFLLGDAVDSVKATGDYELTIKLKKPFAAFPALLAFSGAAAVSPKAYEIGAGKFKPNTFVGTGPYKLAQFSSESQRLDVFDQYWGEKPVNKGIDVQVLSNSANLFNAFRTGGVDVAYLSLDPDQIASLKDGATKGSWQAIESQGSAASFLVLNTKSKPLDNPVVRGAIASIVNRPLVNERSLKNQAEPLYSMVPTTFDVYKPVFKDQYGDGNTEKAKQLLQQAGYSPTNPLKLQIWYPSSSPTRRLAASTLKAVADQQLGGMLQFEVNTVDSATFFKSVSQGLYQTVLLDWYPDFLDPDNYVQPFLECPKGSAANGCEDGASQNQGSFYYSDRMNQLIAQERKEQNPEARKKIFADIQDLLAKDVPYVPLWQSKDFAFTQKGVSGLRINPTQDFAFWTIKK